MPENPRIEELRRRVQADPASIAFAALAEEFRRIGRYDDAITTCRVGLQRHPAYLSARVTLGRALIEVGDYDNARAELETVLQSAPENLAATRGLEQIQERLGHSTEMHPDLREMAREPIRLAAERGPLAPDAPPAAPVETGGLDLALAPEPSTSPSVELSLGNFELSVAAPEPASADSILSEEPKAGEPFDIFGAALTPAAAAVEAARSRNEDGAPDPHLVATLTRLERFLGAIESARHA